jgi:hypothetical protein
VFGSLTVFWILEPALLIRGLLGRTLAGTYSIYTQELYIHYSILQTKGSHTEGVLARFSVVWKMTYSIIIIGGRFSVFNRKLYLKAYNYHIKIYGTNY